MSAARLPHGTVRVANVYRHRSSQGAWHPDRASAEATAKYIEKHGGQRLVYRIVARFK